MDPKKCRATTQVCPHCGQPTRLIRCGKVNHPSTEEHIFPTGYGHQPPFGNGKCPNVFEGLTPIQLELLRDSYISYKWSDMIAHPNVTQQYVKLFNIPIHPHYFPNGEPEVGSTCYLCSFERFPEAVNILKWIFDTHIQKGEHPRFGYNRVEVMQDLAEATKDALSLAEENNANS